MSKKAQRTALEEYEMREKTAKAGDDIANLLPQGDVEMGEDSVGPLTREEEKGRVSRLVNSIGGFTTLQAVLKQPNCDNIDAIIAVLNQGKDDPAVSSPFGRLFKLGRIGVLSKNGTTTVVGPGRYMLPHPRAGWEGEIDIGANLTHGNVGPIHIIRIPNGHWALCWDGNRPFIVNSEAGGFYAVNSEYFRFEKFVPITDRYISHGTIHIVRVPQGMYACVVESGKPALLPHGVHVFDSQTFRCARFVSLQEESFTHQTITRFVVRAGAIGLAWKEKTNPLFFKEPGVYFIDSPMFDYGRSVDIGDKEITLGSRKIITVHEGEVGISHDNGQLVVLAPGRHFIEKPGHLFDEFVSTQQQGLSLQKDDSQNQFMICETRELVRVGVQAFVFYHISDPRLAVIKIGTKASIEKFINETATAVITTIIRSTSLAEISQAGTKEKRIRTSQDDDPSMQRQDSFEPNLPFFDKVKDDFISRLQTNFLKDYGIFMLNIRIGDFKVLEEEISRSISRHALITAETQANLANLEGRRQIDLVNKDSDARIEKIQAEVEAHKLLSHNKAQAEAVKEQAAAKAEAARLQSESEARAVKIMAEAAEAKATAMKVEAEAKAKTIQMICEAEANATRLRGEAEADRAQRLGATEFGRDEALAVIQANMVTGALQGVEKVVYMPTELQRNPFAFFGEGGAFPMQAVANNMATKRH